MCYVDCGLGFRLKILVIVYGSLVVSCFVLDETCCLFCN